MGTDRLARSIPAFALALLLGACGGDKSGESKVGRAKADGVTPSNPKETASRRTLPPAIELTGSELCDGDGRCWVSPRPHGNDLLDVATTKDGKIWAVGEGGTMMHFDGTSWSTEFVGEATLRRVWVRGPDELWVIGYEGFVARRDTKGWHVLDSGVPATLNDIGGAGDDLWIVGDLGRERGVALHWDGHELEQDNNFPTDAHDTIEVFAPDDIWVGGSYLYRYDGDTWTRDPELGLGACSELFGIADQLWCLDESGRLLRRAQGRWDYAKTDGTMATLASDPSLARAFTVGGLGRKEGRFSGFDPNALQVEISGYVLRLEAARWQPRWSFTRSARFVAAAMAPTGELVAVGRRARIARGQGESWHELVRGVDFSFSEVLVDDQGLIVANVWDSQVAVFSDGALEAPERIQFPPNPGDSALADRVAEGLGWLAQGDELRFFDGTNWHGGKHDHSEGEVVDVWVAGPEHAWAVVHLLEPEFSYSKSWILEWGGERWRTVEEHDDTRLNAIDGVNPELIWVGGDQTLLRWDGSQWHTSNTWPQESEHPQEIGDILALAADDLWVADRSTLRHFDGEGWTSERFPFPIASLAASEGQLWVAGQGRLMVKRSPGEPGQRAARHEEQQLAGPPPALERSRELPPALKRAPATSGLEPPVERPPKTYGEGRATVKFSVGDYNFAYLKVDGRELSLEPTAELDLKLGTYDIAMRVSRGAPWIRLGLLELDRAGSYVLRLRKPGTWKLRFESE